MAQEHLQIAVSWNDGRKVTVDVVVADVLGDEKIHGLDVRDETAHPIDLDVLETDASFRSFIQEATRHAGNGDVVHGVTLRPWRGKLLVRAGVTVPPIPDPIPYDAEGDAPDPDPRGDDA